MSDPIKAFIDTVFGPLQTLYSRGDWLVVKVSKADATRQTHGRTEMSADHYTGAAYNESSDRFEHLYFHRDQVLAMGNDDRRMKKALRCADRIRAKKGAA